MKILYHHRTRSRDGQAVHIEEIVKALGDLGHQVVVAGPAATGQADFGDEGGLVAKLKRALPAALYEILELAYSIVAFWRLWQIYRREKPDVLYERYNLFLLAGVWLHRLTGLPMLLEVNAPLVHERSKFDGLANRRLAGWIERLTWRAADRVLPVTDVLAGFVRRAGVPDRRITIIQNGVGAEFLAGNESGEPVRARYGLQQRLVLGFTGFVRPWHGLDRVIDLIADSDPARQLHLLLVGDGPALPELEQRARERGVGDRVTFAGLVSRHDVIGYVAAFDIALQPQVVDYASPLKVFEYMALGRAIVAPATANIREVLRDGDSALLFDPADPAAFRAATERLCGDGELRRRIGDGARRAVAEQGLTWAGNARRIVALFEDLRAAKAGRPPAG